MPSKPIPVYLEIGQKRSFAGAMEWPGWIRSGRNETEALEALVAYAPRYEAVLRGTGLRFKQPTDTTALAIVERLDGTAATDFGAPDVPPTADSDPFDAVALKRATSLLRAYWRALDAVVIAAEGKVLRKGPRGGGRELDAICQHLLDVDTSYLRRLGWKSANPEGDTFQDALQASRRAMLEALEAASRGELPEAGPRGGKLWTAPTFVRRVSWHLLDHLWEIEDRVEG